MIEYHVGNLFEVIKDLPSGKTIIIPHICNDIGGFGAGFVVHLAKTFPIVKECYREWHRTGKWGEDSKFKLGSVQFINCAHVDATWHDKSVCVCNMIAQQGVVGPNNPNPIKYSALAKCLLEVGNKMNHIVDFEVHTCAFGSGLAGGNWSFIKELIDETLPSTTHIYTLTEQERLMLGT